MATLSQMIAFRDSLQDARFSGVRSVRDSSGEEVTYRSDQELSAALAALESEINNFNNLKPSTIVFATSKGMT
jgi:hypothetical protein